MNYNSFIPALLKDKTSGKVDQSVLDSVDGRVNTLIGGDAGKSARIIANEELAKQLIPESAKESLDSLEEIARWIQAHPDHENYVKNFTALDWADGKLTISKSEHSMSLVDGNVVYTIYSMDGTKFTTQTLCVMDTEVSITQDENVVLSYPGTGYAGKIVLVR